MCQGSKACKSCTLQESKIGKMSKKLSLKSGLGRLQPAGEVALGMVLSGLVENYLPGSPLVKNVTKVVGGAILSISSSAKSTMVLVGTGVAAHGLLGIAKQYTGIGATVNSRRSNGGRSARTSSSSRRMATA